MKTELIFGLLVLLTSASALAQAPSEPPVAAQCEDLDPPESTIWDSVDYIEATDSNVSGCLELLEVNINFHIIGKQVGCNVLNHGSLETFTHVPSNSWYENPNWSCGIWVTTLCCDDTVYASGEPSPTATPTPSPSQS